MVVMTTGIDLSEELFAVNMLRTLKSSLKHRRKHVFRSLQLYGDQAYGDQALHPLLLLTHINLVNSMQLHKILTFFMIYSM